VRTISREEAREYDRLATEKLGIPPLLLMENAALGVARELLARPGGSGRLAFVCGPGNNGGDAFAAARHAAIAGAEVRLHMVVPPESYREGSDAAIQLHIARSMGIPLRDDLDIGDADWIVDGIFGTGLVRDVRDPYRSAITRILGAGRPVLSIDVPSGLDANSGRVLGIAVRATCTVTMIAPKRGFLVGEGPRHVGEVVVAGIGAPLSLLDSVRASPPAPPGALPAPAAQPRRPSGPVAPGG
jgi:NAD(P)H-hydrate epimerase